MNLKFVKRSAFLAILSTLAAAAVLSAATYAWFTSSRNVSTSRIQTSTGSSELTLYVKASSDSTYSGNVCELQFNSGNHLFLLPVSTADLQNFVYCPASASDRAENFTRLADLSEQNMLCYGAIDMRAELGGEAASSTSVAVYLDQSDAFGMLAEKAGEDSLLLNAARLGIAVHDEPDTARIFYLSDEHNEENQQVLNTVVNGELQPGNIVLKSDAGGNVTPVPDPALPLSAFMLSEGYVPGEPLFYLKPGADYQIDVFFYLEGCDPDCSDSIEYDAADFGLAFYATLAPEG
ncbi:MAG: hypothetical protein ACI3XZ_06655 [Butyricicoccus sp.]